MDLRREECRQAAGINERVLSLQGSRTRKIARVALARHIVTLAYYGLRDGEIRCLAEKAG